MSDGAIAILTLWISRQLQLVAKAAQCPSWSNNTFMKTLVTILTLLLASQAVFGVVVLPPAAGTNNFAAFQLSQRYFESGQLDQLQKQLDLVQAEFLFLAIAVGTLCAASVITIRSLREAGRVRKDYAEESNTNK
jgi:hypothetical protein